MVPIDLSHLDKLGKAVSTAVDLAKLYGSSIHLVAVTAATPSAVAHNPKEFAEKLARYADEQAEQYGVTVESKALTSHDPAVDLDHTLSQAAKELQADLVVMASHVPAFAEHVIASNAGYLASHLGISVFVVR
jgi:nucleotide-binding universal stress UspA family protein